VAERDRSWTFLTNHAAVLLCLARDPSLRMRDIATKVGITERAAQQIVRDLEEAGYLSVTKTGRRNSYKVNTNRPLRHPLQRGYRVTDLVAAFPIAPPGRNAKGRSSSSKR